MALLLSTALASLSTSSVDLILKATVLLFVAWGSNALLGRASAALRHRIWGLAMIGLVLLPASSWMLPEWGLPVLPIKPAPPVSPVATNRPEETAHRLAEPPGPSDLPEPAPLETGQADATLPENKHSAPAMLPAEPDSGEVRGRETILALPASIDSVSGRSEDASSVWSLLTGIWILGSLGCLASLAMAGVRTARWKSESRRLDDSVWKEIIDNSRRRLRIRRRVPVCEHAGVTVPMTCGIVRPMVILPGHARIWQTETRQTVLLHELAHVQRRDVAWQWLGRLACALYWFHPLAWLGLWQMRLLREHACDDAVVQSGERASHYVQQLLEVARHCRQMAARHRIEQMLAVEMTNGGKLERRVQALFDSSRSHGGIAPRVGFALSAASLVLVGALAVVRPVEQIPKPTVVATRQSPDVDQPGSENIVEFDELAVEPVSGQVVLQEGGPAAGARVVLRRRGWPGSFPAEENANLYAWGEDLETVTADAEGRFAFAARNVKRQFESEEEVEVDVIAFTGGRAPDWVHVPGNSQVTLRLAPESQLTGRVVDAEGQAVAGARIRPGWTMSLRHLTQADLEEGRWPSEHDRYFLGWFNCRLAPEAITNDNGEFTLRGLPAKLGMRLHVSSPRFAPIWFDAATLAELDAESARKKKRPVAAGDCAITLPERRHPFTVRVVDDLTGDPIDGAQVQTPSGRRAVPRIAERGSPESRGYYEFASLPDRVDISAESPIEQGYLRAKRDFLPATAATGEIRMVRGKRVEGRVVDDETGIGVPRVTLRTGTENAAGRSANSELISPTDDTGRFVALLQADSTYALQIRGDVPGYLTHNGPALHSGVIFQNVTVQEGVATPLLEFRLKRSRRIEGIVIDTEGVPVPNMEYSGFFRVGERPALVGEETGGTNHAGFRGRTDSQGKFSISEPFTRRDAVDVLPIDILFHEQRKQLVAQCLVDPRQPLEPQRVVANRAGRVTGRVLDEAGRPLPHVRIECSVQGIAAGERFTQRIFPRVRTDQAGRFELRSGVPGRNLWLHVWSAGFEQHQQQVDLTAESADRDLGDLTLLRPRNRSNPLTAPAPDLAGLSGERALEKLAADYATFRQAVSEARKSPTTWPDVVESSTLAYATAIRQVADAARDPELKLKALIWILQQHNLSPRDESRYRQLQGEAAARLLADYPGRAELATCALNVIRLQSVEGRPTAAVWREAAQRLLAMNSDPTVLGMAAFAAAEAHLEPRGPDDRRALPDAAAIEAAVPFLERVVQNHANVMHPWRNVTLGELARGWLFDLRQLNSGLTVPELEWNDIDGRPVRLSNFRGKLVVIDCCSSGSGKALGESDYSQRLLQEAGPEKAATIVVVYDDIDEVRKNAALFSGTATIIAGDDAVRFFRMWNVQSWPTAFVVDAEGKLRAKRIRGTVIAEVLAELLAASR